VIFVNHSYKVNSISGKSGFLMVLCFPGMQESKVTPGLLVIQMDFLIFQYLADCCFTNAKFLANFLSRKFTLLGFFNNLHFL
jgi:hypothetical protein